MNLGHRFLEMFMFTSVFNEQISSTHHLVLRLIHTIADSAVDSYISAER